MASGMETATLNP